MNEDGQGLLIGNEAGGFAMFHPDSNLQAGNDQFQLLSIGTTRVRYFRSTRSNPVEAPDLSPGARVQDPRLNARKD